VAGRAGTLCESPRQESQSEIGVSPFGADVAFQLVSREKPVELLLGIAGVGRRIERIDAGRDKGQPGRMSRDIDQRDLPAIALGHFDPREILGDGVFKAHFAALHHVSQEKGREYFGEGADLEYGVERAWIVLIPLAMGEDSPSLRSYDAHDDAGTLMLDVDMVDAEGLDFLGRRQCLSFGGTRTDHDRQ